MTPLYALAQLPDYLGNRPVFEQAESVESVYFARMFAALGLPDPGKMSNEAYKEKWQHIVTHAHRTETQR